MADIDWIQLRPLQPIEFIARTRTNLLLIAGQSLPNPITTIRWEKFVS